MSGFCPHVQRTANGCFFQLYSESSTIGNEDLNWSEKRLASGVTVFLLFQGLGPNCDELIKLVRNKLINKLEKSESLEEFLRRGQNNPQQFKEKATATINRLFLHTDNECCKYLLPKIVQLSESSEGNRDDAHGLYSIFHEDSIDDGPGCYVLLVLVFGDFVYFASCGNFICYFAEEFEGRLELERLSAETETGNSTNGVEISTSCSTNHDFSNRCFGLYKRKLAGNSLNPLPLIFGPIELRSEAKSLVLLTPDTGKNLRSILSSGYDHGRNEGDDDELIKEFIRDNGSDIDHMANYLTRNFPEILTTNSLGRLDKQISIARIDLCSLANSNICSNSAYSMTSEYIDHARILSDENDSGSSADEYQPCEEYVESEVDWSEFHNHEQRDTILAKIESIKQYYEDVKKLSFLDKD